MDENYAKLINAHNLEEAGRDIMNATPHPPPVFDVGSPSTMSRWACSGLKREARLAASNGKGEADASLRKERQNRRRRLAKGKVDELVVIVSVTSSKLHTTMKCDGDDG